MECMILFKNKEFHEKKVFKTDMLALEWIKRNINKIDEVNYHPLLVIDWNDWDGSIGSVHERYRNDFEIMRLLRNQY